MDKPNVLLLTIDTLRADKLGCYGYDVPITPNIDRLAASSIRFEQAITGGSWTQAAFPVVLTSTYASMYGGCLGPLSPERPSPVEALANNGYTTGGFSTSPLLSRTYGYHHGFKHFVDLTPDESQPLLYRLKGGQRLLRHPLTHSVSALLGKQLRPNRLYVSAAELNDHFCRWLDDTRSPFFAWVHYMDIHWPYHREETLDNPAAITQIWQDLGHMHRVNRKSASISPEQRAHYIRLYEEAVRYTDVQIGRLLDYLETSGRLDNTIIILVSDHGEEFLERSRWGHFESNLYDEILKVPFIIYLPGESSGKIVEHQVRTLDIMPTVLDLCGCPAPENLEGASLTPLWNHHAGEYNVELSISEMWRDNQHIVAVRTTQFKYIWKSRYPDDPELYDLQTDPAERDNIYSRDPEQSRRFQACVDDHLRRVAAQAATMNQSIEPELDDEVIQRLRDLGYVE